MLWVYGHLKYFYSYSAVIDFNRQNLTSTDVFLIIINNCIFVFDCHMRESNTFYARTQKRKADEKSVDVFHNLYQEYSGVMLILSSLNTTIVLIPFISRSNHYY